MSLNLHDIVRPAITRNLADESCTLYRSAGQVMLKGVASNVYNAITITAQWQSEGDSALDHANLAGQNTTIRRVYLYAANDAQARAWGLYRPLGRTGDYLLDAAGRYWLVVAVTEDYSAAGWECLRVQLQTKTPVIELAPDDNSGGGSGESGSSGGAS